MAQASITNVSITNVLQKPFRRNFATALKPHCFLIDPASDGGELQSLISYIAIKSDLIAARAPGSFAGDKICKVWLVSPFSAIIEIRRIAAKAGLRIPRGNALHFLDRAADVGGWR